MILLGNFPVETWESLCNLQNWKMLPDNFIVLPVFQQILGLGYFCSVNLFVYSNFQHFCCLAQLFKNHVFLVFIFPIFIPHRISNQRETILLLEIFYLLQKNFNTLITHFFSVIPLQNFFQDLIKALLIAPLDPLLYLV